MKSKLVAIIIGLALVVAVSTFLPSPVISTAGPVIIENDVGGGLNRYRGRFIAYQEAGTRVEIKGRCASACTIYIALPNACIHPEAKLGFHGATFAGIIPSEEGNQWVAQFYPPELRLRFLKHYSKSLVFTWKTGAEVLAMKPKAKPC